eukprot:48064-Eustigmatos_ZCMA.PRE.1
MRACPVRFSACAISMLLLTPAPAPSRRNWAPEERWGGRQASRQAEAHGSTARRVMRQASFGTCERSEA